MSCLKLFFSLLILERCLERAAETTEEEVTWPEDVTEATLDIEITWPDELPVTVTIPPTFRTARTMDHLDALRDEDEFFEKPHKLDILEFDSLEVGHRVIHPVGEMIALKRKPLPEEKLIKQPFYFGCCHNSTNVGCAGVCPETCEYRSKYCVPLCGPPCRCKHGFVYNIARRACNLRSDCPKGVVQSKNGIYRVFL
ncbi:uncharacterized protein LOC128254382 [Drosophila gunungcola]|uniref:uncharacterized protein LOC128254382 n=1 Tax=Drosophila gunungcola TaxID=103775 RepID=UPI0022E63626|nr:uncharacterized protein LOC128254382 [Drosophila gunungcola]